ncbi:MAG: response regulator [Nitrospirae bacterium]|nr:response regulator [Nitrospirota bacterium]
MKNKILIVDDAMLMRIMLRDIFEASSFQVVGEAEDAEQALQIYKETHPDLVTMDITLTSSSGIDAITMILDYDRDARIIVISALEQRNVVMEALRVGARDFIIKPFEENRVIESVRDVLCYA